jgi:hypothetical protein
MQTTQRIFLNGQRNKRRRGNFGGQEHPMERRKSPAAYLHNVGLRRRARGTWPEAQRGVDSERGAQCERERWRWRWRWR